MAGTSDDSTAPIKPTEFHEFDIKSEKANSKRKLCQVLGVVVVSVVLFVVGFLIGYYVPKSSKRTTDDNEKSLEEHAHFHEKFQTSISTEELEKNLR